MVKCEFCKRTMEPGTGKLFIKKDGKSMYFCSTKCEKNTLKLNRKPRETRWTAEFSHNKKSAASKKGAAPKKK